MASSVMHRFAINMPREPKWFKACAEGYLLSGRLNDICDHNAIVARNAGRNDVCNCLTYRHSISLSYCIINIYKKKKSTLTRSVRCGIL